LGNADREPTTQPISKLEFDFERKKLTKDDVRELIYREVCSLNCKYCFSFYPVKLPLCSELIYLLLSSYINVVMQMVKNNKILS
jgi:sulfatase maturation enzyme AslB (radical SAM superfamily)